MPATCIWCTAKNGAGAPLRERSKKKDSTMLRAFPMILVAVLLYNIAVFAGGLFGQQGIATFLNRSFAITMMSGDSLKITTGDLFLLLTLGLLFAEVVRAARSSHREILNHALSMLTFVGALAEFLLLKGFGTATFLLITAMSLFDVVAGYTISIVAARRDMALAPHHDHDPEY
jgi:hypothetical protein